MIFGQKMKLIIITIIKHHNSKHYIHSIFINTYDNYLCLLYDIALKYSDIEISGVLEYQHLISYHS
jgi:hypothetical protein